MRAKPQKSVAYLSAEFLIGPQLNSNLLNLGIQEEAEEALRNFGIESLQQILDVEEEPGLGQWWPRAAGSLLHGLLGKPEDSSHGIWHSLLNLEFLTSSFVTAGR